MLANSYWQRMTPHLLPNQRRVPKSYEEENDPFSVFWIAPRKQVIEARKMYLAGLIRRCMVFFL
jgi:hypothetical protein